MISVKATKLFLSISLALSLGACISAGPVVIPPVGASEDAIMKAANQASRRQDKYAMLELGKRYEYGLGVKQNWTLAARLYYAAALSTSGGILGRMPSGIPMAMEPARKGIREARDRLNALRAKMKAAGYKCSGAGWTVLFC